MELNFDIKDKERFLLFLNNKIDERELKLKNLTESTNKLQDKLDELDSFFNSTNTKKRLDEKRDKELEIIKLNNKYDNLETKYDSLNNRFKCLDASFKCLDNKYNNKKIELEKELDRLTNEYDIENIKLKEKLDIENDKLQFILKEVSNKQSLLETLDINISNKSSVLNEIQKKTLSFFKSAENNKELKEIIESYKLENEQIPKNILSLFIPSEKRLFIDLINNYKLDFDNIFNIESINTYNKLCYKYLSGSLNITCKRNEYYIIPNSKNKREICRKYKLFDKKNNKEVNILVVITDDDNIYFLNKADLQHESNNSINNKFLFNCFYNYSSYTPKKITYKIYNDESNRNQLIQFIIRASCDKNLRYVNDNCYSLCYSVLNDNITYEDILDVYNTFVFLSNPHDYDLI